MIEMEVEGEGGKKRKKKKKEKEENKKKQKYGLQELLIELLLDTARQSIVMYECFHPNPIFRYPPRVGVVELLLLLLLLPLHSLLSILLVDPLLLQKLLVRMLISVML